MTDPTPDFDLSVILNVHDDAIHLARTLRSTEDAARYARHLGSRVELVVVLDRPTQQVVDLIDQFRPTAFDGYRSVLHDHDSPGHFRNTGVEAASGTYVALCDSDDLISFNGFAAALESARSLKQVVVVPEYVFVFGDAFGISRYATSDVMTPLQMVSGHQYTSRIVAPRTLLLQIPLTRVPVRSGYASEDWHHNCELLAAGVRFVVAPNSMLFYRRRAGSQSSVYSQISTRQILPSTLFEPRTYLESTALATSEHSTFGADQPGDFVRSELCRELVYAANQIDPAIRIGRYETAPWVNLRCSPIHAGLAYRRLCEAVGGDGSTFTDVVFASAQAGRLGAEKVCRVLQGFAELRPGARTLVLSEDSDDLSPWQGLLPDGSIALAMRQLHPSITVDEMDTLALKAVQAKGLGARIHLGRSLFGARFWRSFGPLLPDCPAILHRIGDESETKDGRDFIIDDDVELISNCLDTIQVVLAASAHLRDNDHRRFQTTGEKWHVLEETGETATTAVWSELEGILHGDRS